MAGAKLHINADSSKAQKELLSFKKKTSALTKSIAKGFTERIGHKLFDGLKAAVADIPRLAMDAVNAASDMNEELSKSEAVFDASAQAVTEWSKTTTKAFGISRVEALRASAEMGNMLRAFSIGSDEASTMSMRLVELAGDFASFNNASIEDTLYAIGAALRGENEPIKKYIGNISQATIQSKALELGLYSGKGAIDENAKALAVYNIILDSSERQIGDAAKTSKNLAGQKRILTAQIKDLQAEIGQKLLPTFTELVTKMNETDFDQLAKDIGGLASAFVSVSHAIVKSGQGWAEFIRGLQKAETPKLLDKLSFIPQVAGISLGLKGIQAYQGLGEGGEVGEDEMMDMDKIKKDEAWDKDFDEEWEKEKEKRKKKVAVDAANAAEAAAKAAADAIVAEKKRLELLEEQKKEREAIAAAAKAQQNIDDRMGQIGGVQASLQNAMTRSSISAVSSMQSIGGGGGVYGELDMMKTQVDLQEKLVILNEELCELARQQIEQGKDGVAKY
jgi:hypothetical protein